MKLYEKILAIQSELKAPKGQYNSFGKFKYRSCEDILEALKPLLTKYKCLLVMNDEIVQIGERYYVKATADIFDTEEDVTPMECQALAREELDSKGMSAGQLSGATSSYARKYCLGAMFLIDDNKDLDTDEFHKQTASAVPTIDNVKVELLKNLYSEENKKEYMKVLKKHGFSKITDITEDKFPNVFKEIKQLGEQ